MSDEDQRVQNKVHKTYVDLFGDLRVCNYDLVGRSGEGKAKGGGCQSGFLVRKRTHYTYTLQLGECATTGSRVKVGKRLLYFHFPNMK